MAERERVDAVRLGAALFNGDHGRLAEELTRLEAAGLDFVHLDVFDGYFVGDVGFAPRTIAALRPLTRLPFEVHLGVAEPARFIPQLVEAGADLILVHLESMAMVHETLFGIHRLGSRAGLVIALGTPVASIQAALGEAEAVLVLSRVTGEGTAGAGFDRRSLSRIAEARRIIAGAGTGAGTGTDCELQAAGGLNRTNIAEVAAAGASALSFGAGIYRVDDMGREVAELRRIAAEARRKAGEEG